MLQHLLQIMFHMLLLGDMVYISGQISGDANGRINGKLGENFSVEEGQLAAKSCGINLIAQLKAACDGDLDRLVKS
jgi:enamine deaminase RidA (YjgF/YER057c/UK114 family)